jgi:hypothetical protein
MIQGVAGTERIEVNEGDLRVEDVERLAVSLT